MSLIVYKPDVLFLKFINMVLISIRVYVIFFQLLGLLGLWFHVLENYYLLRIESSGLGSTWSLIIITDV